jgi:hypothetical protein
MSRLEKDGYSLAMGSGRDRIEGERSRKMGCRRYPRSLNCSMRST